MADLDMSGLLVTKEDPIIALVEQLGSMNSKNRDLFYHDAKKYDNIGKALCQISDRKRNLVSEYFDTTGYPAL